MSERFAERMAQRPVVHDTRVVGDFTRIYCEGVHKDRPRSPVTTEAALLGVYGRKTPVLCEECAGHLAYAEKRRAYCPKDPKPFCAHCDTHCYSPQESAWQRQMMRYSGPRSWKRGHLLDVLRHAAEARRMRSGRPKSEQAPQRAADER